MKIIRYLNQVVFIKRTNMKTIFYIHKPITCYTVCQQKERLK